MSVTLPLYTSLAAAAMLALQLALMLTVGLARGRLQQSIGDGGHEALALKIRRHGNLAENAAIFLVALALLEMIGGDPRAVLALGGAFLVARIAHAVGLSLGTHVNAPRVVGAFGTLLAGLGTAFYLAYVAAQAAV